jgi:hypothetical protein
MAAATEKPLFRLSEDVTEEDIPVIAAIGDEIVQHDTHTKFKTFHMPEEGPHDACIRGQLKNTATSHVIKAVHNETNEIMGYICWAHRGYVPRVHRPETTGGRLSEQSSEEDTKNTKIQIMEDIENKHYIEFMTDIMPEGIRCWIVAGFDVAPKFQQTGVSQALLNWGTSRAEKDGVFAWVYSSDSEWEAYAAAGFDTVRVLKVDMDDYAEGTAVNAGPGEGGKWGIHTVRYMVYEPERVGTDVIYKIRHD